MSKTPNQPIKTKKSIKKSIFVTDKVKKSQKFCLTEFTGSTIKKILSLKKYLKTKSTNQSEIFPKKTFFSTLKVYRIQEFLRELPDNQNRVCKVP
jgi:L-cysteine desulfidase